MAQPPTTGQLVQTFASYLPPAVARAIHADPRPPEAPVVERFPAAVLLCDISGFTALTERLATLGVAGAEELIHILNGYFSRMIGLLEAEGGEVVQFSGDALIAVFPADKACAGKAMLPLAASVRRAWQAAARMQAAMPEFATLSTSVGPVMLGMKIAIGAGVVVALSVGGVFGRWQYLIAGDPLRQVAEAGELARRGEIRLSPEAQELFSEVALPPRPLAPLSWPDADAGLIDALRSYIPGAIAHRLIAGQADWLAELRRMTILFIGVGGLSADTPDALAHTHASMVAFQETVYRYEGSINKLLVDDKGAISIVLFGAPPLAHLDDPARAVHCALDMQRVGETLGLRLAIGITTGQVFAGPVGSPGRREYTVIGDAVNLAARLMQTAGRGGVRADYATFQATRDTIDWLELTPQIVKGKAAAVRVYQPGRQRAGRRRAAASPPLVGRAAEVAALEQALEQARAGALRAVCLSGPPGSGKSRLLLELSRLSRERGLVGLMGSGRAIAQQTAYRAWTDIFESYFDLDQVDSTDDRRARTLRRLAEIAPAPQPLGAPAAAPAAAQQQIASSLGERAPLLNDLLDLGIPETPLTADLDPRLRQGALTALLVELLRLWALENPLVIVLEDAHWLDSLSWQLALQVARELSDLPVLLVLALRPLESPAAGHPLHQIAALPGCASLALEPLGEADIARLASGCLDGAALPPDLAELIARRAAGNPFVATALALALRDTGAIEIRDGRALLRDSAALQQIPDTVQGLVLSRIDRLPVDQQLTIKVASVIGRTFGSAALGAIHPAAPSEEELRGHLEGLTARELVAPLPLPSLLSSHEFVQTIFQEVTYTTLLSAQRRALHEQLALWYEQRAAQSDLFPLLAYHWRQARRPQQERRYATLAARQLAAEYANQEALVYLTRALELTEDPGERYDLLWLRMQVYGRVGDTQARRADLEQLAELAERQDDQGLKAQTWNAWADLYRDLSDYPAAVAALERALALARAAGDATREARSLTIWGQVMEYQGAFDEAHRYFEQALAIYRRIGYRRGEATNLSQLGNIAIYLGDYQAARAYDLEALSVRRAIGDRASETTSLSNLSQASLLLGELEAARDYSDEALQIARAIGDRAGEALSLSMIGDTYFVQGDYAAAGQRYEQALRIFQASGERRREANCLNLLGQVWRDTGDDARAQRCFEDALAIQLEIGDLSLAAFTLDNLAYMLAQHSPAAAAERLEQALEIARSTGNHEAEAYTLNYRAALHERAARLRDAEADYRAALALRTDQQAAAAIEDRAGLARVALGRGEIGEALEHAHACLAHIAQHGVEGMEFPLHVYMACYDALRAAGRGSQARWVIEEASSLLQRRAEAISDAAMRERMLTSIPVNRRVLAEARAVEAAEVRASE